MLFSKRKKKKQIALCVAGSLLAVLAMCVYGYNASWQQSREEARQKASASLQATPAPTQNAQSVVKQNEPVLQADAKITLQIKYQQCGHVVETDVSTPELQGSTRAEVAVAFPNATIVEFSPQAVLLNEQMDGFCDCHYILRLEGQSLKVYKPKAGNQEWELIQSIDNLTIPPDPALEQGILFDDIEQVEGYLENIES